MRIKIGKYTSWLGPYQLAEKLCFWTKKEKDEHGFPSTPDWVHNFGEWLADGSVGKDDDTNNCDGTTLYKFLTWLDSKKKRKVQIHIDSWDTWSMDHTLALIILPMLKQLQATKHGSPIVDDKDVPKALRSTEAAPVKDWETDDNIHKRWNWVLNELIWAFEQIADDDNDAQFHDGTYDIQWKKAGVDDDGNELTEMISGPKDTHTFNKKAYIKHHKRIQRGTTLFGKYFRGLWD